MGRDRRLTAELRQFFALGVDGVFTDNPHGVPTDTVRAVTGSEPRGIAEFARDHAGAFGGMAVAG